MKKLRVIVARSALGLGWSSRHVCRDNGQKLSLGEDERDGCVGREQCRPDTSDTRADDASKQTVDVGGDAEHDILDATRKHLLGLVALSCTERRSENFSAMVQNESWSTDGATEEKKTIRKVIGYRRIDAIESKTENSMRSTH